MTANAQTQIYGNATPALTYTVGGMGLVNGDTLSGSLATTASATSSIGSYAITQGTLAASNNYAVTYTGANDVIVTRAITVTANGQTQIYGNATPALTYAIGGLASSTAIRCRVRWRPQPRQHQRRYLRHHPGYAGRVEQLCGDLQRRQ